MGIYDSADSVAAGAGTKRPPLPVGFYPALLVEQCADFKATDPKKKGAFYYKADLQVLTDGAPAPKGTGGTFLTQVAGNQYTDHDTRGIGQVKDFLGCVLGLPDRLSRTTGVGQKTIEGSVADGGKLYAGKVVSATVTHKVTAAGETLCNFEFGLSSAAAPAPTPAAPAGPPAGWLKHTDPTYAAQGWHYNPANTSEMKQF